MRLVAGALLLLGLAFVQDPGLLIADTKFDLAVDPGGFLARAAHLWDGEAAFGQLQNQAYGYWWPMGPFFWLATTLGADGWVAQRLWLGLVMVVAFVGTAKLSRALGVRNELACLVAASAFALSPRLVSILGGISIEAWPSALAPWVLLPLVHGAVRGSPRRAAALSALAVGMIGGVNAAATAAALPLGALWLLTRSPGSRRRSMMLWWPAFTFLATAWWLVPLLVLGAFSPPFLDWIESASITTFPTTPFDAVRGTSAWIPYIDTGWDAGNDLLRQPHLILNSGVLLALGVAGLLVRRNPHRLFLVLSVVVGLLLVSLGHVGRVDGWFADSIRGWLDGPLAPIRNVHKFDPVLRLPLVVGVAWCLESLLARRSPTVDSDAPRFVALLVGRGHRIAAITVATVAVAATASPAALGRLAPDDPVAGVPDYWSEAARWLSDQPGGGSALLVPGTSFGSYVWGSPRDEPMQYLADSPWAVRNAVPLAPAGNIRMLDAIEERVAQGHGSSGLATFLARAGVRYLLVRNDLERSSDTPDPVLVHQALRESPGILRAAEFGPSVGGGPTTTVQGRRVVVNGGWQSAQPALEIYAVSEAVSSTTTTDAPLTVVGGPEDLLDLADLGIVRGAPTILAPDADATQRPPGGLVLTDGLRDRERFFGRIHDATSPVRLPGDARTTGNPTADYLVPDAARWATTASAQGSAMVSASSSAGDAAAPGGSRRGFLPYAATDGDIDTAFRSNPTDARPTWRLTMGKPARLDEVELVGGRGADPQQRVVLRTDRGAVGTVSLSPGVRRRTALPAESIRWLQLEPATGGDQLDVAEVAVPGISAQRWLRTPELPPVWGVPDAVVLRADVDDRTGCAVIDGDVRCSPEQPLTPSEEPGALRRLVSLPESGRFPVQVRARADQRTTELLLRGQLGRVGASSRQYPDLRASAVAAVDGDPGTTWLAAEIDEDPTLSFAWLRERRVRGVALELEPEAPAREPRWVRVEWDGGVRVALLDGDGEATFRPFRADRISVEILHAEDAVSLGFDGEGSDLPIGVSEARVLGVPEFPLALSIVPRTFPCGSGPSLDVNGAVLRTRVNASDADILAGRPVPARPCRSRTVTLDAGTNRISLDGVGGFLPSALILGEVSAEVLGQATTTTVDPVTRSLDGVEEGELVAVAENANPGWEARQGDGAARPAVVDGWRQAWWSTSAAPIRATFQPDVPYRVGMLAGAVLAVGLVGVVVVRSRRWPRGAPPLQPRSLPLVPAVMLGLLVSGLLAGWIGTLLGGASMVAVARLRARSPVHASGACALLIGIASLGYAAGPWASSMSWAGSWGWPAYLTVMCVAGALTCLSRDGRRTSRNRWAGRSTVQ